MKKKEYEGALTALRNELDLLHRDYDAAIDSLEKFEHRHILVTVKHDGLLLDAVIIPPNGRMSSPIITDPIEPDYTIDLYTEVISNES